MKILYLGELGHGQTALMRMQALERLGHQVRGVHTNQPWQQAAWLSRQIQRRLPRGPIVERINSMVLEAAREMRPELVWADKQEYLYADTIETLRKLGARTIHFTPDPYFTLDWKRTRLMDEAMQVFDVLLYCKNYERAAYQALGKPLIYMPLGYCDQSHRPLPSPDGRWNAPVGFLGGWEPRRQRMLKLVAEAIPDMKFWGGHWGFVCDGQWTIRRQVILGQLSQGEPFRIQADDVLAPAYQGGEVYGDDYARALTGCKIGLGFLRTICPDQHTTRTFEIPACGSLLLADRTDDCCQLFDEGREAEFFSSADELLSKVKYYQGNERARDRIAAAGHRRCIDGRYAYIHRIRHALDAVTRI